MKFFLKKTIYLLPYLMMGVCFISIVLDWFDCYNLNFWANVGGYSLLTDVLFFYVFYYGNYCWITKSLPIAMFGVNILNIIGIFYPSKYSTWYEIAIFSLILSCGMIYELNRRIFK